MSKSPVCEGSMRASHVQSPRVGIISLAEAGNLGDDLILLAVIKAIHEGIPDARIRYLSHGIPLDWPTMQAWAKLKEPPTPVAVRPEFLWVADNRRIFAGEDAIVFGGGGLLQNSHSRVKPYQWLSYLPDARRRPPVLGVGHGLGPLSPDWMDSLRRLGDPFDESWIRDETSRRLSEDGLGWPAKLTSDFVTADLIAEVGTSLVEDNPTEAVGVAVRGWPGLSAVTVADRVRELADEYSCDTVKLFVLEAKFDDGPDVRFAREVSGFLSQFRTTIHVYQPEDIAGFLAAMRSVRVALAMKLHACVVWGAFGTPIVPIYYAPKVSALFGQAFDGLTISDRPMNIAPASDDLTRASEVIRCRLPELLNRSHSTSRFEFSTSSRLFNQVRRSVSSVSLRLAHLRNGQ